MLKSKHVGLRKAGNQTAHKEEKMPKKLSDNEATDSKSGKYIQRNNCIQSGAISPLMWNFARVVLRKGEGGG